MLLDQFADSGKFILDSSSRSGCSQLATDSSPQCSSQFIKCPHCTAGSDHRQGAPESQHRWGARLSDWVSDIVSSDQGAIRLNR